MNNLSESQRKERTEALRQNALKMSAKEIEKMLTNWLNQGRMTSKTLMGKQYYSIKQKIADRKIFYTSIDSVLVSDEDAQNIFEALHDAKRIMTREEVTIQSGNILATAYAINREVKDGGLLRFDLLGRSAILYIA